MGSEIGQRYIIKILENNKILTFSCLSGQINLAGNSSTWNSPGISHFTQHDSGAFMLHGDLEIPAKKRKSSSVT